MAEWHRVTEFDELIEEQPVPLHIGGVDLAVYRLGDEAYAIGDICPHQKDVKLSDGFVDGDVIECPMHQSCFNIRTGKVESPPAREDVPCYPIKIENGVVYVQA
jgi:NAD(P)H-dependent nitrite reductase small subunit